jgi:hypothetical protein
VHDAAVHERVIDSAGAAKRRARPDLGGCVNLSSHNAFTHPSNPAEASACYAGRPAESNSRL